VLATSIITGTVLLDRIVPSERQYGVSAAPEPSMCVALAVIVNATLYDRVAPLGASPEYVQAVASLNAQLSEARTHLYEMDGVRQLGCRT
jgi:hypothetical protein